MFNLTNSPEPLAPSPTKGRAKRVFQVLDTLYLNGPSTLAEIMEDIPQVISRPEQRTEKKVRAALYWMVYAGHVVESVDDDGETERWRVAPRSFYEKRRAYMQSLPSRTRDTERNRPTIPQPVEFLPGEVVEVLPAPENRRAPEPQSGLIVFMLAVAMFVAGGAVGYLSAVQ